MKIRIENREIEDINVVNLKLRNKIYCHSELEVEFEILSDINLRLNDLLEIVNDKISIFKGNIYEYEIEEYGYKGIRVKILAKSFTKLMDINRNKRIYQDESTTYDEIIKDIMAGYKIKYHISKNLNKKINRMYFQNNISDFNFIERILKDIDEGIFVTYNGLIVFGYENLSTNRIDNYYKKKITNKGIKYEFYDKPILTLDNIDNKYVVESNISYDGAILTNEILLSNKNMPFKKIIPNIKGSFIEARVLELTENLGIAKMKLDFSISMGIDNSRNKRLFSFATPYSKTMTGMYVTPEIYDVVDVYFPSDDENEAKVAFCINNKGSSRFIISDKKNYISKDLIFEIDNGKLDLNLGELNVLAIKKLNVASNSYIAMEAKDDINIYANRLALVSKGTNILLNANTDILLKAKNKIHNN